MTFGRAPRGDPDLAYLPKRIPIRYRYNQVTFILHCYHTCNTVTVRVIELRSLRCMTLSGGEARPVGLAGSTISDS